MVSQEALECQEPKVIGALPGRLEPEENKENPEKGEPMGPLAQRDRRAPWVEEDRPEREVPTESQEHRVNAEPMETPVNKVLLVSSDRPVHLDFLEFPE